MTSLEHGPTMSGVAKDLSRPPAAVSFMTVAHVAEAVALHPKVVRRAIRAGELRAVKLRTRIRIRVSDFEAWLEASRVEPYPIPELEP